MKDYKKLILLSLFVIIIIIIDQIVKFIIPEVFDIAVVKNTGGAFGIGQNSLFTFIVTNIVVLGIIVKFIISQMDKIDKKTMFSFLLILGGGASNLIDRIFKGFIVDFIDINSIIKFPIFNLADICIVVGFILLVIFITIYTFGKQDVKL